MFRLFISQCGSNIVSLESKTLLSGREHRSYLLMETKLRFSSTKKFGNRKHLFNSNCLVERRQQAELSNTALPIAPARCLWSRHVCMSTSPAAHEGRVRLQTPPQESGPLSSVSPDDSNSAELLCFDLRLRIATGSVTGHYAGN